MKLNKTLLSIGTIAAVATPVATVVACGDSKPTTTPPVKGTKGGTTPGHQGPVIPASKPETQHTDTPKNTGPSQSKTQTVELDDGVFDYSTDHHFSNAELNNIFNTKFTEDINFGSPTPTGKVPVGDIYNMLGGLGKEGIDTSRTRKKILIASTPNGNNGSYVLLAGVVGYKIDATGKPTNEVIFRMNDFNDVNEVSDASAKTSEKNIILSKEHDPGDIVTVFSLSIPTVTGAKVFADLVAYVKPFFTDAKFA